MRSQARDEGIDPIVIQPNLALTRRENADEVTVSSYRDLQPERQRLMS